MMTGIKALVKKLSWSSCTRDMGNNVVIRLEPSSAKPITPVEQLAVAILTHRGAMPLAQLIQYVATELYRQELGRGGRILDMGLFGSRLFVPQVIGAIEARNGSLWRIEERNYPRSHG